MSAKKNRICDGAIIFALAVLIAGCSPPGPRALFKGKKLLERGNYAAAVEQFKTATSLLATNAQAWNYLGVARQSEGQFADAAAAYQRALALNRDLVEAHYNLGCLWLEQNKFDSAKTELTAYTLRRGNSPEGWLKLGSAQLHSDDPAAAEKSFRTALYLSPNNAEALNGLGLASVQRGRAQSAAQFFAAAIQHHPDYAPAILNLAAVAQEYLHDNKLALQNYQKYLALTPRPENWNEVNAIANSLEQPAAIAPEKTASVNNLPPANLIHAVAPPQPHVAEAKKQTPPEIRPALSSRAETIERAPNPPPRAEPAPAQVVKVNPEPAIVAASNPAPVETPPAKPGILDKLNPVRWFSSSPPEKNYSENGVTPLPLLDSNNNRAPQPIKIVPPAPPVFPRYLYLSPRKPKSGDRAAAMGAFTKAREFEQESRWPDAMEWYRRAAQLDPTWFEAQYNYGVLADRLRNFSASLAAYEMALAIEPASVDARYNFALTLEAAGYAVDAADELKKIVAANPGEVRAQLALGNLYAQQLRDPERARKYYLKVLELDPHNPHATDIRFWLSANPS